MYVNPDNSKRTRSTGIYGNVISQIAKDGVCPFCPEHLTNYHKNPLEDQKYWQITDNMYPYKPTKHHRLIIHKTHITHITELNTEAWAELFEIIKSETLKRDIQGGTIICRFGETRFTGASVSHLHVHLVQVDPDDPDYENSKGLFMRIG